MLFINVAQKWGVDAVLVADIPLLAKEDYVQAAKKHGIQPSLFAHQMRTRKRSKV
ncbi:tryptophan synthase subunit alpha [Haemophilus influenzae]|uniref:tryptophan synthase n=1 Tax=Haemophilus influenzae TaxID=727 RepID=A0A2X1PL41_HAEIF|nr:tryptophan synthase subunit alpha [Haemophilus influenzae]